MEMNVIETVAHWLDTEINTVAHALSDLEPHRQVRLAANSTRRPWRTTPAQDAGPSSGDWEVVTTTNLPVVIRHKQGVIQVWRCDVDWANSHEPVYRLVDRPILVSTSQGTPQSRTEAFLRAIAMQRTKQARRSTVCAWCAQPMIKGERFSTYCCHACATRNRGAVD